MDSLNQLVTFSLDDQQYGMDLWAVERVVPAVAITPLPNAPDIVLGVINIHGGIIPVTNIRRRFGLPEREMALSDQLIIGHTSRRPVALVVDTVNGLIECFSKDMIAADTILPHMEYIKGVVKLKDGMILIHNLEEFLSLEEARSLDEAMEHV